MTGVGSLPDRRGPIAATWLCDYPAFRKAASLKLNEEPTMAEITLDFLAQQQARLLEAMGQLRDDIRVMAAIVQRLDGTVQGLINEVRAERSRFERLDRRVSALEEGASE
jgi:hypothetical protein